MVCAFIDVKATGERIRQLLDDSDLSLQEILEQTNVTKASICGWKSGRRLPSIDNLVILATMLDVTLDDILVIQKIGGEKNKN